MQNNEEKNLEAIDEVYKGLFRTPFAFLIGGPVGLIANAVYTAGKAHGEIKREKEHKAYIESIFAQKSNINYVELEKIEKDEKEKIEKENLAYLIKEFSDAQDVSWLDGLYLTYSRKEKGGWITDKYRNRAVFHYYSDNGSPVMFGGDYLPEAEFIQKYKIDLFEGNIIAKCIIRDNNVRATFCYKTIDNFIFTGMFTQM